MDGEASVKDFSVELFQRDPPIFPFNPFMTAPTNYMLGMGSYMDESFREYAVEASQ